MALPTPVRAPSGAPIPDHLPAPALDQLSALFGPLSDSQLRCVLKFDGRLDAERLQRALRLSFDAEPVLGCRFVRHSGRLMWERCGALDDLPLCQVTTCADAPDRERVLQDFLIRPMDISAGPAAAACLVRGQTDVLAVKLHHFAADGLGMLRFLMVLAALYRELGAAPDHRPRPNLASRGQGQVLRQAGPPGLLLALASARLPRRAASWGPIARDGSRGGREFAMRRLPTERVRALRAWCHAQRVSVNDVLLAALYRALYATVGGATARPLAVGVPIDLRRYLTPGQVLPVCNLSNSADVAIAFDPDAPFEVTLRRCHAAMRALKTTGRGLTLAVLAEALAAPPLALARTLLEQLVRHIAPTGSAAPFLSNVGVIDERLVDFGERTVVDAYGLGTISYAPGMLLTVSTFREVMTLAVGFCGTATRPDLVARLLDRLAAELPA